MYLSANKLNFRSPPVALAVYSRIAGGPAWYRRAQRCESPVEADTGWVPFKAAEVGGRCGSVSHKQSNTNNSQSLQFTALW